jgi:hypothetical protein
MKHSNLLPAVFALLLVVAAVGCTTVGGAQDEYYEQRSTVGGNRVYVDDPYRGTVVLERDPFTGRYYEVSPYGAPYGAYNNNRIYRGNSGYYGRTYNNRNYNNRPVNVYRGSGTTTPTPQQPTDQEIRNQQKSREEARKKVLGN